MTLAFIERFPTEQEVERIRLLLSTYQDGTGMLAADNGLTLPGWRDFERSVALALQGQAAESKAIFDVTFSNANHEMLSYGLSCKMRRELNRVNRDGRVTIEVSNTTVGEFWKHLAQSAIHQQNYRDNPANVGNSLLELVNRWHQAESTLGGGKIDLARSYYSVLLWNTTGWYRLYQYPLNIVSPDKILSWTFPSRIEGDQTVAGRRLIGFDDTGTLVEWYGEFGGQLKYYPLAADAIWSSEPFRLEPLPHDKEHGILTKVAAYYPELWSAVNRNSSEQLNNT